MKLTDLKNKQVISKDGKKLGKIIRIDSQSTIGDDDADYFAIIQIHPFIRRRFFPMSVNSLVLTRVEENVLQLDMTKKDFFKLVKQYETERKIKAKEAKMAEISAENKELLVNYRTRI
jgi:hypothetical protein